MFPLLLTMAFHLGVLLLAMVAPRLMPKHLQLPEVYQVELYTTPPLSEPVPPPLSQPAIAEPQLIPSSPPPMPTNKMPSKPAQPPQIAPSVTKSKAVSLSPVKEQLLRETREREHKARLKQEAADLVAQIKREHQIKLAEEQRQEAARQGTEAIAEFYRAGQSHQVPVSQDNSEKLRDSSTATGVGHPGATGSPTPGQLAAQAAYIARLKDHLRRHWKLPVLQDWDEKLSATVIIKIKRDGNVITSWFEKHSNNSRFDQYVKKAVDQSSPLPPLPKEFEQKSEEIAVTFTPGGLK